LSLAGANLRDYAILQVFLQTGMRVSELCARTREDVVLERRVLRIASGKRSNQPRQALPLLVPHVTAQITNGPTPNSGAINHTRHQARVSSSIRP
jgi:integrase